MQKTTAKLCSNCGDLLAEKCCLAPTERPAYTLEEAARMLGINVDDGLQPIEAPMR